MILLKKGRLMDLLDKQIIRIMQDEFPLVKEPYKEFAKKLNISEQELLNRLRIYKEELIHDIMKSLRQYTVQRRKTLFCFFITTEINGVRIFPFYKIL